VESIFHNRFRCLIFQFPSMLCEASAQVVTTVNFEPEYKRHILAFDLLTLGNYVVGAQVILNSISEEKDKRFDVSDLKIVL